jgi:hypothetical protein
MGSEIVIFAMGIVFVIVGLGMAVNIAWGLIAGGPRDKMEPGQPRLYDRFYYLLFLLMLSGWAFGLLSFGSPQTVENPAGFMIGWGVCAIGIALIFLLRGKMMLRGATYLARHGFILWRPFYAMQAYQLSRQPLVVKFVPYAFLVAGSVVLIFQAPHFMEGLDQARAGAVSLIRLSGLV